MLNVSDVPIPNGVAIVNVGLAGRCDICGNMFDEGGICNYGHFPGRTYYYVPEEPKPAPAALAASPAPTPSPRPKKTVMVVCQANANHCNICGAFFAEGDNVCEGRHFIGEKYSIEVNK